ncbi:MAG: uracil-DNA glycosylase [Deltaproteobacteria bacterium]|nr:uracil-DNA glycosylase [Deltaproteobacteria bacterium]
MDNSQLDFFRAPKQELSWRQVLEGEKESAYFKELLLFLEGERRKGKKIYPPAPDIFNALSLTPFNQVKAVIVGQDPYHGPGQAHGLCFSVKPGVAIPPSLDNIFKELQSDLGMPRPAHGSLEKWAREGVLLLNAVLTVESGKPQSHAGKGWERFTDRVIRELNIRRQGLVFLLWGSHAQKKCEGIDQHKHLVLRAPHPSPLSAHRGFLGCRHFSKTNEYLIRSGQAPINWSL